MAELYFPITFARLPLSCSALLFHSRTMKNIYICLCSPPPSLSRSLSLSERTKLRRPRYTRIMITEFHKGVGFVRSIYAYIYLYNIRTCIIRENSRSERKKRIPSNTQKLVYNRHNKWKSTGAKRKREKKKRTETKMGDKRFH